MTTWLQRQRKQTLLDLSDEAGLRQDTDSRKEQIVDALDAYLQRNATQLGSNASFDAYYRMMRRTPFKGRSSSAVAHPIPITIPLDENEFEVKSVVKGRGRRTTKVKQEFDSEGAAPSSPAAIASSSTALAPITSTTTTTTTTDLTSSTRAPAKRTPGRPLRPSSTQRLPVPASPADVANLAEYETTQLYAGLNDLYSVSGVPETIDYIRETCSSVSGIQTSIQLLEALCLQRAVLPWLYLTELNSTIRRLGLGGPVVKLYYPDLFALLSSTFWAPTLIYATTAIFLPSLFAYFFNLTLRDIKRHGARVTVARYTLDPLTFNIVKAVLTYVVYARGVGGQIVGEGNVGVVENAMVGGYQGMLVGNFVVMIASLYEAAQGKV
ncbi:hypothetical protein LTR78_009294 [Recurvomyces mirabilis]|uniref:Uncharacterized protein n=1 Tax=Recurvomyces mirabilis TaxID=574656 RepID=A0AAE0TPN0_9PEZI|nr:hypothetical protein LTR78_009294 [Recurvomyces mirabilis]KAK5156145.1 hypothetical protein LTS14_005032 [Recurvomyces mirabilis]